MGDSRMTRNHYRTLAAALLLSGVATIGATAAEGPQAAAAAAQQLELDAPPPMPYTVPSKGIKDFIKRAVENPTRQIHHTVHDYYRKPAEVMQFANLRQGMRVVEISAYGNYWSTMLVEALGPKGELHMFDMPFAEPAKESQEKFIADHPNSKVSYKNVDFNEIEFPKGIDMVWCFTCFHEVLGTNTLMDPFLAKLYKAMKPGAVIMVVFYTARDGMENRDMELHRIDPGTVRGTFQAAGFQLQQENRLLQNPKDDKKTPVHSEAEGDLADRMVYRFVKT
jgi:predicted methyltransferase